MASLFVDSSALVKRYRHEDGSRRVSDLLESADRLLIARLTIVEVSSALVRRARMTTLPAENVAVAIAALDDDILRSFEVVELDQPVMMLAVVIARKHGLRGADAIQLACAILTRQSARSSALELVSSDDELNAAAASEGLPVVNPNVSS
jgi:predicted nucleic acid-binding protein